MQRFLGLCGLALLHFVALSSAIFSYTDALQMRGEGSFAAALSYFLARVLAFPVVDLVLRFGYFPANAASFYLLVALNSFAWALFLGSYLRSRGRRKRREYSRAATTHPATTHSATTHPAPLQSGVPLQNADAPRAAEAPHVAEAPRVIEAPRPTETARADETAPR